MAHLRVFASDRTAASLLDSVRVLRRMRDAATRGAGDLDALLALQGVVPAELLGAWHRRVAATAEQERGPHARVAGEPPGFHWLAAGEHVLAIASLRAALSQAPEDARARAFLADALYLSGEKELARREYLIAFTGGPDLVAVERVADPEVARLADLARHEYELEEPAAAWVPAVGIVERIFPLPPAALPGVMPVPAERARPLAFVDLIARERGGRTLDERVTARRRMKVLAPLLFDAYLATFA